MTYSLTLRQQAGRRLSIPEVDNNWLYLESLALSATGSGDGTQGPQGPTGPQGEVGPVGPTGPSGISPTYSLIEYLPTPIINIRKKDLGTYPLGWSCYADVTGVTAGYIYFTDGFLRITQSCISSFGPGYTGGDDVNLYTIPDIFGSGHEFQYEEVVEPSNGFFFDGTRLKDLLDGSIDPGCSRNNDGDLYFISGSSIGPNGETYYIFPDIFDYVPDSTEVRRALENISFNTEIYTDIDRIIYPEEYYKEKLDISFNSFGTQSWLSFPDKRVELLLVSNKGSNSDGIGNKNSPATSIVHPPSISNDYVGKIGTIFSGGSGGSFVTEFPIDESLENFGSGNIFNFGRNNLINPNITIEIDVRDFFKNNQRIGIRYPVNLSDDGETIFVKSIGPIKYNSLRGRVYKRNLVLYFRLSAGKPGSLSENGFSSRYNIVPSQGLDPIVTDIISINMGDGLTILEFPIVNNFLQDLDLAIDNWNGNNPSNSITKSVYDRGQGLVISVQYTNYVPDFTPIITVSDSEGGLYSTASRDFTISKEIGYAPNTYYRERIYSDLSIPVYISPRINTFKDNIDYPTSTKILCYGHKILLGKK